MSTSEAYYPEAWRVRNHTTAAPAPAHTTITISAQSHIRDGALPGLLTVSTIRPLEGENAGPDTGGGRG